MNRRLFLGHVLAAVGAVASVPLLTKLLPLPLPTKAPLLFHRDAFAMVMQPIEPMRCDYGYVMKFDEAELSVIK